MLFAFAVFALAIAGLEVAAQSEHRADSEVRWVRTRDGWEKASDLFPGKPRPTPRPHPAVIGAGQLLISLFALLAFDRRQSRRR